MESHRLEGRQLTADAVRYRFDRFILDSRSATVHADGQVIALRRRAFDLLQVLLDHAPALVGRDQILDEVWGHDALTANVLPQAISEIRHALGDSAQSPRLIETLHRRGYRMLVPVERLAVDADDPGIGAPDPASPAQAADGGDGAGPEATGHRRRPGLRTLWPVPVLALALLLAWGAITATGPWRGHDGTSAPPAPAAEAARPAIALMIQSDPQAPAWLAAAGDELLAVALAGDNQVRLLRGDGRSDVPAIGDVHWQAWLREVLGADYALTGLWRLERGQPVLGWSLLRLADSQVVRGGQAGSEDLAAVSRQVALDLRRHLQLLDSGADLAGLPDGRPARDAYYRGLAALADGRAGPAVAELELAVADAGAGARVRLALARAWRASGHIGKAREQFQSILATGHGLGTAERLRLEAESARADNRPADAAASLLALHRLVPDDAELAYALIDAQIQARQYSAADNVLLGLDTLSAEGSRDPRWHLARAQLAITAFDLDQAAAATQRALDLARQFGLDELAAQAQLVGVAVDRRRNDPQAAGQRLAHLLAGPLTPAQRVRTLLQQGNLLRDTGQFDQAEAVIGQAITLATELGNDAQQLLAQVELHTVKSLRSHSDQALAELEALEPRITALDDPGLLARYFNTLGVQATANREIDKADAYLRRAAAQARKAGQIDNEAGVYNNLGNVLARNDRPEDAVRAWEQALRVFNEVDNALGAAITLSNLGGAAVSKGNLALAREQFQQALDRFTELDSGQHMARTRFDLGQVAERQGRLGEAARLYDQALAAQREVAIDRALHAAAALARVQLAMARAGQAQTTLDGIADALSASTDAGARARVHAAAGHIALATGQPAAARTAFDQAHALHQQAGTGTALPAWSGLDLLLADLAQAQPAGQVRARGESLYRQFVLDGDTHGQLRALALQARALLAADRPHRALPLLEKAEALLAGWPDAGLAYELGRLRILAEAPLEAPGRIRLHELAEQAEADGFLLLALRARLDADPADAGVLAQAAGLGLDGIASP